MKPINYYHHIDNGGIAITFSIVEGFPTIEFSTQYLGYTSVSSKLQGHEICPRVLREIAEKFKEFADATEEYYKEDSED
jgi:hypothetical protein